MIKVAFIKFGGLSSGGTERLLHSVAVALPKDKFVVDYYYTDSAPYIGSDWVHPDTDPFRKKYLEENGVNLIRVNVEFKDVRYPTHPWVNTDLWEKFNEQNYDVICSGRAGHPEFPFTEITQKPTINILALIAGVDNQSNIFMTTHLTQWAVDTWISHGGDRNRVTILPVFKEYTKSVYPNMREELGLTNKFVYGFHQRPDNGTFSEVPLLAYSKIEDDNTCFLLLGGGSRYADQVKELGIKNFIQLKESGDDEVVQSFVATLDVFSHGRNDGETFGSVFTDAMFHSKPCITHNAANMGHVEVMGDGGRLFDRSDIDGYAKEMLLLRTDREYYLEIGSKGNQRFHDLYSYETQVQRIEKIFTKAANIF